MKVSNPEKVLFPKDRYTKQDVVDYYDRISPLMLPHLKGRLLALQRFPNGIGGKSFFQKNASEYFPGYIRTFKEKGVNYVVCNDRRSLLYLANQAALVFHVWGSRTTNLGYPDKLVFDLDPGSKKDLILAARGLKKILESLKMKPFLMSTGSKGAHLVVPIKPENTFVKVTDFAKKAAEILAIISPDKFTTELAKDKRNGRVFIDPFRNSHAQVAVCPYSIRPFDSAPVAAPLSWEELDGFDSKKYNIRSKFMNPWTPYFRKKYSLNFDALENLLDASR